MHIRPLLLIILLIFTTGLARAQTPATPTVDEFTRRYHLWLDWVETQPERALLIVGAPYRELVEMGPASAPRLAEALRYADDPRIADAMAEALIRVMQKSLNLDALPEVERRKPDARTVATLRWWNDDRPRTREIFEGLYARWRALRAKGETTFTREVTLRVYDEKNRSVVTRREVQKTELADVYAALGDMGIDILPLIMAQLQAGETELLPLVRDLTHVTARGATVEERTRWLLKWWESNKGNWLVP